MEGPAAQAKDSWRFDPGNVEQQRAVLGNAGFLFVRANAVPPFGSAQCKPPGKPELGQASIEGRPI